jgi:hypothetical protein
VKKDRDHIASRSWMVGIELDTNKHNIIVAQIQAQCSSWQHARFKNSPTSWLTKSPMRKVTNKITNPIYNHRSPHHSPLPPRDPGMNTKTNKTPSPHLTAQHAITLSKPSQMTLLKHTSQAKTKTPHRLEARRYQTSTSIPDMPTCHGEQLVNASLDPAFSVETTWRCVWEDVVRGCSSTAG